MKQISISFGELPTAADLPSRLQAIRAGAQATLRLWRQRAAQRRLLAALAPRDLDDIGITEAERLVESGKPFWRA